MHSEASMDEIVAQQRSKLIDFLKYRNAKKALLSQKAAVGLDFQLSLLRILFGISEIEAAKGHEDSLALLASAGQLILENPVRNDESFLDLLDSLKDILQFSSQFILNRRPLLDQLVQLNHTVHHSHPQENGDVVSVLESIVSSTPSILKDLKAQLDKRDPRLVSLVNQCSLVEERLGDFKSSQRLPTRPLTWISQKDYHFLVFLGHFSSFFHAKQDIANLDPNSTLSEDAYLKKASRLQIIRSKIVALDVHEINDGEAKSQAIEALYGVLSVVSSLLSDYSLSKNDQRALIRLYAAASAVPSGKAGIEPFLGLAAHIDFSEMAKRITAVNKLVFDSTKTNSDFESISRVYGQVLSDIDKAIDTLLVEYHEKWIVAQRKTGFTQIHIRNVLSLYAKSVLFLVRAELMSGANRDPNLTRQNVVNSRIWWIGAAIILENDRLGPSELIIALLRALSKPLSSIVENPTVLIKNKPLKSAIGELLRHLHPAFGHTMSETQRFTKMRKDIESIHSLAERSLFADLDQFTGSNVDYEMAEHLEGLIEEAEQFRQSTAIRLGSRTPSSTDPETRQMTSVVVSLSNFVVSFVTNYYKIVFSGIRGRVVSAARAILPSREAEFKRFMNNPDGPEITIEASEFFKHSSTECFAAFVDSFKRSTHTIIGMMITLNNLPQTAQEHEIWMSFRQFLTDFKISVDDVTEDRLEILLGRVDELLGAYEEVESIFKQKLVI